MSVASRWSCGGTVLDLGRARVMGVLNVTPDSFSDGGEHRTAEDAVAWGVRLLDEGADIVDVGGESTRPGFTPVDADEEAARVVPVVRELSAMGALVSVDTRHALVARAAVEAGARIINDVSGFSDPHMAEVAAGSGCGCVVMHALRGSLGEASDASDGGPVPRDPDGYARYVADRLLEKARTLEERGVDPACICIDPGPGFGTDARQDLGVQRATGDLAHLGYPLMCAVSRKRFIGKLSGIRDARERDGATAGCAVAAVANGARVVRVHDVRGVAGALMASQAVLGTAPRREAFVALGSNMGDRVSNLAEAVGALALLPDTEVLAVSDAYETEPAYLEDQPAFVNAVAKVRTRLHPMALLRSVLDVEDEMGRVRLVKNGPRCVDLDLLWMQGEEHAGTVLRLPHPRIGERDFVLRPLADLVGDVGAFCVGAGIPMLPEGLRIGRVVRSLGRFA